MNTKLKKKEKKRKEKEEAHTNELLANNTGALAQASIKKYIYFISRDYIK